MEVEKYKSKWFNWTYFLISSIDSKEEAEYMIHDLKNIFYVIAGLLVVYSFFTHVNVVLDVLIILTLATLMANNKSRTAAVMLLLYQLGVLILTIVSNVTNAHSGQNIWLSAIILAYAIGSVRATFMYNKFIASQICWDNVFKIQMFSFLVSLAVFTIFSFNLKSFHFSNVEQTGSVITSIVIIIYFLIFLKILPFTKKWETTGTKMAGTNIGEGFDKLRRGVMKNTVIVFVVLNILMWLKLVASSLNHYLKGTISAPVKPSIVVLIAFSIFLLMNLLILFYVCKSRPIEENGSKEVR